MKIPKRSDGEVAPETLCFTEVARQKVYWSDGDSDTEEKASAVDVDILSPDSDHADMSTRIESQPIYSKREQTEYIVEPGCGPKSIDVRSLTHIPAGEISKEIETDRKRDKSTGLEKLFRMTVGIVDRKGKPEERKPVRQWDAICSAIDLRIADVVRGHVASASLRSRDNVGRSLTALVPCAAEKIPATGRTTRGAAAAAEPMGESEAWRRDEGHNPMKAEVVRTEGPSVPQGEVRREKSLDTHRKEHALANKDVAYSPVKGTERAPNTPETMSDIQLNDYGALSDNTDMNNSTCEDPDGLSFQPGRISLRRWPAESLEKCPPCALNDSDGVACTETCHSTPASPNVCSQQSDSQACSATPVLKPDAPRPQHISPEIPTGEVTTDMNADYTRIMDLGINSPSPLRDKNVDTLKPTSELAAGRHSQDGHQVSVAIASLCDGGGVCLSVPQQRGRAGSVDAHVFVKSQYGDIPERLANESRAEAERISGNWHITDSNQSHSISSAQTCVVNMNHQNNNPAIAKWLNERSIIANCMQNNTTDSMRNNDNVTESQAPSIITKYERRAVATLPRNPVGNTCADGGDLSKNTKQRNHATKHRKSSPHQRKKRRHPRGCVAVGLNQHSRSPVSRG
ncbi:hypothetical protein NHX12_019051 [Muraenolepis orangiensis]|uniref:Uncharacterized protein n=1 Tax=Muraenolepis orangiensis TaxID=630683 RepID=A0A9Q0IWV8_9TELE|nr:hypothetical protein NHX12_019051 [Muraenolepis orangiensis]